MFTNLAFLFENIMNDLFPIIFINDGILGTILISPPPVLQLSRTQNPYAEAIFLRLLLSGLQAENTEKSNSFFQRLS